MVELKTNYASGEKEKLFTTLQPLISVGESVPYADLAAQLEMTEGAVKVAVHRLRERYRKYLRQRVAQTIVCDESLSTEESAAAVDEELGHLLSLFSNDR